MAEDVAIGIDLGTTYCCVAIHENGGVTIIENDVGSRTTPSYVTVDDQDTYVGEISKQLAHENPEGTIFDVKRLIGRKFGDPYVQSDMKLWPFDIVNENLLPKIKIDEVTYFPEEISAKLLQYLKQSAEDYLGHPVIKAVITVPAYFNDGQRRATRDAGKLAGLNVLRIINEPTAAAIAYNLEKNVKEPKNCLIFDLGGGTLDVSVLTMEQGKIDIKAVDGHTHLGGEDFDNAMATFCIEQFKKLHSIDLNEKRRSGGELSQRKAVKAIRRLKAECERQKMFLSSAKKVDVSLFALYEGKDLNVTFDQDLFNQLNAQNFDKCMEIVDNVMESSQINKSQIADIVLIGGSSRIPKIQQLLSEKFGGKSLAKGIDPETAVAYGAAVQAFQIVKATAKRVTISDVVHLPIGIEYDRAKEGDPNFAVVVPKNSKVPCSCSVRFLTVRDNQEKIKINVYEGEGKTTEENHLLGNFEVTNLPKCDHGEPVEVTLEVDSDGILRVSATMPRHSVGNKVVVREQKKQVIEDFSEMGVSFEKVQLNAGPQKVETAQDFASAASAAAAAILSHNGHDDEVSPPLAKEYEEKDSTSHTLKRQPSVDSKGKSEGKEKTFTKKFMTLSKVIGRGGRKFTNLQSLFHKPEEGGALSGEDANYQNLPPVHVGVHIDHEMVSMGVYNFQESGQFEVVMEKFCPSIVFLEDRIIKGPEATRAYSEHSNFYTFYRLLTIKATKIHELTVNHSHHRGGGSSHQKIKLRNEEALAAFLVEMKRFVETQKMGRVQSVAFALSFLASSDHKERLKAAATLAGFQKIRIVSSLLATGISMGHTNNNNNNNNNETSSSLPASKFTFVMEYDQFSFSSAIVEIQGGTNSFTTWAAFSSETLPTELKPEFVRDHAILVNGGKSGREEEKVVKLVYDEVIKRCEKQAGNVPIKDFVVIGKNSSSSSELNGVDKILMATLVRKLTKLSHQDGPLKGAAILASSMGSSSSSSVASSPVQSPSVTSSCLSARDVSHFDLKFTVGEAGTLNHEQFQHVFADRLVFSQEVTVPKMRPCLLTLKQVLPNGTVRDVCDWLLTLPPKLREGPVATINCHVDHDGIYSLSDVPVSGVPAKFVRTDRFLLDIDAAKGSDSNFSKFLLIFQGPTLTKRASDASSLG